MILYFHAIWSAIVKIITKVNATYWKLLGSLLGFTICILLLISFNNVRNLYIECNAFAENDSLRTKELELAFRTNHAMSKTAPKPMSELSIQYCDDQNQSTYISDSTKQEFIKVFGDSIESVHHINYAYNLNCIYTNDQPIPYIKKRNIYLYINLYDKLVSDDTFVLTQPIEKVKHDENIKYEYNNILKQHCTIASVGKTAMPMLGLTFSISTFNRRPSIYTLRDISQCVYTYKINTDAESAKRIEFDFLGAVNLSNMYPTPDKTTMTGMEFTDSVKLKEILDNGLTFHASFPQAQNLQTIRVSVLSLFLPLLFSLSISLLFKLVRDKFTKPQAKSNDKQ